MVVVCRVHAEQWYCAELQQTKVLYRRQVMGIGSLLGKLFGSGDGGPVPGKSADPVEYNGFKACIIYKSG